MRKASNVKNRGQNKQMKAIWRKLLCRQKETFKKLFILREM